MYAFWGLVPPGTDWVRQTYRLRFGIETSYRQLNQGKAVTTSTDPRRRLLWLGLALLLRQAWVWCQRALSRGRTNWACWRPREALSLSVLLAWLAGALQERYPANQEIRLPQPVTSPFSEPGAC